MAGKIIGINDVRKILDEVWKCSQARGRCWGKTHNGTNPYAGSHITLIDGQEAVTIFSPRKKERHGVIKMVEFKKTEETELGRRIREILATHKKLI